MHNHWYSYFKSSFQRLIKNKKLFISSTPLKKKSILAVFTKETGKVKEGQVERERWIERERERERETDRERKRERERERLQTLFKGRAKAWPCKSLFCHAITTPEKDGVQRMRERGERDDWAFLPFFSYGLKISLFKLIHCRVRLHTPSKCRPYHVNHSHLHNGALALKQILGLLQQSIIDGRHVFLQGLGPSNLEGEVGWHRGWEVNAN